MLAVAGAGKTYHICHAIDPGKKNLLIAFTHANIENFRNELIRAYGGVPELTTLITFHSFIYRFFILPFESTIREYFSSPYFRSQGVSLMSPPAQWIRGKVNPSYKTKDKLEHYINHRNCYYCDCFSELVLQIKKGRNNKKDFCSLLRKGAQNLNLFFDEIWVDEFQDFRNYDYDFLLQLSKELNQITLVGDYYQHSVSGKKTCGKPFAKQAKVIGYQDFISHLRKESFEIDTTTLQASRRCSEDVCEFVKKKLDINIMSQGVNVGRVIVDQSLAEQLIKDDNIIKLVYKNAQNKSFKACNWSYSKGNTYDHVCVILTKDFEKIDEDDFDSAGISPLTINKLYVALTRTRGDLYLVKQSALNAIQ